MQVQNINQLRSAINSLQYETGGSNSVDLEGALRETRVTQFTTTNGARLGIANIAVVVTASRSLLSQQVSNKAVAVAVIFCNVTVIIIVSKKG